MRKRALLLITICFFVFSCVSSVFINENIFIDNLEMTISLPEGFVIYYVEDTRIIYIADSAETMKLKYEEGNNEIDSDNVFFSIVIFRPDSTHELVDLFRNPAVSDSNIGFEVYEEFFNTGVLGRLYRTSFLENDQALYWLESDMLYSFYSTARYLGGTHEDLVDRIMRSITVK